MLRAGGAVEEEEDESDEDDKPFSVGRAVDTGWGVLDGTAADISGQKCELWSMLQIHVAKKVQVKMESLLIQNSITFLCTRGPYFTESILWENQ